MGKIYVVGIDGNGTLGPGAREALEAAEVIYSTNKLTELFSTAYGEAELFLGKFRVLDNVMDTFAALRDSDGPCAIIASGDPMFFGIGSKILDVMPGADIEIIPALSSVQLAFSRLRLSWQDAYFMSLHGKTRRKWALADVPLMCALHPKLVILSGGGNKAESIAEKIPPGSVVHVLQRLGYDDETITTGTPEEIARGVHKEPNLLIVISGPSGLPSFGLREEDFKHEASLITKDEVRAVALHKLRLPQGGVFWDVGAGSGSVAIEAKRLSPELDVYAIEKNPSRIKDIEHNLKALSAGDVKIIAGEAPGALKGLPAPDRVFIGGSGEALGEVIAEVVELMQSGTVVASTITLESLADAVAALKAAGLAPRVTSLSVSRSRGIKGREYLKAQNQIFLVEAEK